MKILPSILRFTIVGGSAFVLDSAVMSFLFYIIGWPLFVSRILSITTSLLASWYSHRHWTFDSGRKRRRGRQLASYAFMQILAALINFAIFWFLVLSGGLWAEYPVAAIAVASIILMVISFLISYGWIFADPRNRPRS